MTSKRTPTKDPREFAAYVRAMKRAGYSAHGAALVWNNRSGDLFRAGVAHGRRSKAK